MAIVRPEQQAGESTKYVGVLPVSIWEFKDRSEEFNWCDVFLSVELKIDGSEYNRCLEICGPLDKDPQGNVTGGYCLKPLYHLFDTLGFQGGLNAKGEWEDGDGTIIKDIGSHLNERYQTGNPIMDPSFDHVAYIYKAEPKKVGEKSYTRVYNRLYSNNEKGTATLTEQVGWMKKKGYLKEWSGLTTNSNATAQTENL